MIITAVLGTTILATSACGPKAGAPEAKLKFAVSFPAEKSAEPLDGRVLLMISNDGTAEPRRQISDGAKTQLIFGLDVDQLAPGQSAVVDASAFGYPLRSLSEIPAGEYYVQALLNRYQTFKRADGYTVKLPPDKGEGQRWSAKPGNLYSTPAKLRIDPASAETIPIMLDQEIPPITPPQDTKYIRHERIQSKLLSDFWGTPMDLGAILLPEA
jgi:hypothetical protein